ncbi:MAG: hypothetical protein K6T61_18270, partial [Bryobacteraceae bacterium]|nr:hypothetical protein [Bryobacteraceae bacterium]
MSFCFHIAHEIARDILPGLPLEGPSAEAYFAQVVLARLLGRTGSIASAGSGEVVRVAPLAALPADMLPFPEDLVRKGNELIWFKPTAAEGRPGLLVWRGPWVGPEAETYRNDLLRLTDDEAYRTAVDAIFRCRPRLWLHRVEGLREKLSYVLRSQLFERVGLSQDSLPEVSKFYRKLRPAAEVVYAPTPAHMADIMQVGGWRRHRYVRCPDLLWGVHAEYDRQRPGLLRTESHPEVQEVVHHLANNRRAVLEQPLSPQVVVSALHHINETLEEHFPYRKTPPRFSWAFVRAVKEEQDARFWHVVFSRVLGAPPEVFSQFLHSPTPARAARYLAEALNRFVPPSEDHPGFRAPEILVIIGTNRFQENLAATLNPEIRPLAVPLVLENLAREDLAPAPRLTRVLGQTRVVCLPDDCELEVEENPSLEDLTKFDHRLLEALGTFRWGFTQQMAALMLGTLVKELMSRNLVKEDELRVPQGAKLREKLLDEFVRQRRLLRYGAGVYYLPSNVRQRFGSPDQPAERARLHFSAGVALAPYISIAPVPALAFDLAFLPDHVHEAAYHFREAFGLAQGEDQKLATQAKSAMQHLCRFVGWPHWHAQVELLKDKTATKDAWELGLDLLEGHRQAGTPVHPIYLVNAARAGMGYLKTLRGADQSEEYDEVRTRAEILFTDARDACERPEWRASKEINLLRVLSTQATFIMKEQPERTQDADRLNEEIRSYLAAGVSGATVLGEWFELAADRQLDHGRAAPIYGMGVQAVPTWHQLWIKGVGAELLGDVGNRQIINQLTEKTPEEIGNILNKAASGLKEVQQEKAPLPVCERWRRGIQWIKESFGNHRKVKVFLGPYRFLEQPVEFRRRDARQALSINPERGGDHLI